MAFVSKGGAKRSVKVPNVARIPVGFLHMIATRGDEGEVKYGRNNYKKGLTDPVFVEQFFSHALTHLQEVGEYYVTNGHFPPTDGPEGDELAGAAWGLMAIWESRRAEQNKPKKGKK